MKSGPPGALKPSKANKCNESGRDAYPQIVINSIDNFNSIGNGGSTRPE